MACNDLAEIDIEDLRKRRRCCLDQGHLCAPQAVEGLRQLDSDETGSDHRNVVDLALHETDFERFDVIPYVKGVDPRVVWNALQPSR